MLFIIRVTDSSERLTFLWALSPTAHQGRNGSSTNFLPDRDPGKKNKYTLIHGHMTGGGQPIGGGGPRRWHVHDSTRSSRLRRAWYENLINLLLKTSSFLLSINRTTKRRHCGQELWIAEMGSSYLSAWKVFVVFHQQVVHVPNFWRQSCCV